LAAAFFKGHRETKVVSSTPMGPNGRDFVAVIDALAEREGVEIVHFSMLICLIKRSVLAPCEKSWSGVTLGLARGT